MKCLLAAINAKYIHSNLGVYSLKAYAEKHLGQDVEIEIGEYTINHSQEAILADLYRRKPDVAAFSCYIWNIDYVKQLIADLPKVLPGTRIWLGGPEVSYNGAGLLSRFPQVSLVMKGEGEETFSRLLSCFRSLGKEERGTAAKTEGQTGLTQLDEEGWDQALEHIPGIVYRRRDSRIQDTKTAPLMDLNDLPFPYQNMEGMEHRIIYYESSRGCPFSCSYCLSSLDKTVRFRRMDLVKKELAFFLERRVPQVKFVDRTFNCKKSHAMEIWRYLAEHDNGVTNFHFEISADLLDEEELSLFRKMRPGLIQLETGVQTANPRTLQEIRRKTDLNRIREMTLRIHRFQNIHQHLDLIAGLPWEDKESFLNSFDQVYAMRPDQLQLGFLKVLKGSFMEEQKEAYGLTFTERPPFEVLSTRWLSYADVLELKRIEEMVEVYYNSGQFSNTIKQMEGFFPRPARMFQELGEWYEQMGLRDMGHSRLARYENLFRFLAERFPDEGDLFRDALTVDYYLRENAGTRPSFARDQKEYREGIRSFYQEEGKARRYLNCGYEGFDSRQMAKMTHLEVLGDGRVLLFDYRNRDALTKNAAVWEIAFAAGGVQDGEFICGSGSGDHRLKSEDGSDPGNRRSADRRREGGGRISDAGESGISS